MQKHKKEGNYLHISKKSSNFAAKSCKDNLTVLLHDVKPEVAQACANIFIKSVCIYSATRNVGSFGLCSWISQRTLAC